MCNEELDTIQKRPPSTLLGLGRDKAPDPLTLSEYTARISHHELNTVRPTKS